MTTKITVRGQVTVPKRMHEALRLSPGDAVEFQVNAAGEVVLRKISARSTGVRPARPLHARVEAQMRRRAAELLALLRRLD
jgi:antitoxin PrlF